MIGDPGCLLRFDGRPYLLRKQHARLVVVAPDSEIGDPFKERLLGPLTREKPLQGRATQYPGGHWIVHESSEWVANAEECSWLKGATYYPEIRLMDMRVTPYRWVWPSRSEPTLEIEVHADIPLLQRIVDDMVARGELPIMERPTLSERAYDAWLALLERMRSLGIEPASDERGSPLCGRGTLTLTQLDLREGACPFILRDGNANRAV